MNGCLDHAGIAGSELFPVAAGRARRFLTQAAPGRMRFHQAGDEASGVAYELWAEVNIDMDIINAFGETIKINAGRDALEKWHH